MEQILIPVINTGDKMKSLYEKLTEKSRPVEIAVGKKLEQVSKKYYYEVEDQTMDYDVCLVNSENGKKVKVEVKVHKGCNEYNKHYPTFPVEVEEYQYRHNDYVKSHWLTADFDVFAQVDMHTKKIHLYRASDFKAWTATKMYRARHATHANTRFLLSSWINHEAGYITSIEL